VSHSLFFIFVKIQIKIIIYGLLCLKFIYAFLHALFSVTFLISLCIQTNKTHKNTVDSLYSLQHVSATFMAIIRYLYNLRKREGRPMAGRGVSFTSSGYHNHC
jgi:hypothetical protein